MRLGPWEIALIVVAVLLIFGPKRLPKLARSLGQSMREFRKGAREVAGEFERAGREDEGGRGPEKPEESDDDRLEG